MIVANEWKAAQISRLTFGKYTDPERFKDDWRELYNTLTEGGEKLVIKKYSLVLINFFWPRDARQVFEAYVNFVDSKATDK